MKKRDKVFLWPSWLCKLAVNDDQCFWRYWIKSRYKFDDQSSDFSLVTWNLLHAELVRSRRNALEKLGFKVLTEDQCSLKLEVVPLKDQPPGGTKYTKYNIRDRFLISGKPDIIAFGNEENMTGETIPVALIEDAKSGKPKSSHSVQVLLYMLILPMALSEYKNMKFSGTVIYKPGIKDVEIPHEALENTEIMDVLWGVMKQLAGPEENCHRVPSNFECEYCDLPDGCCPIKARN